MPGIRPGSRRACNIMNNITKTAIVTGASSGIGLGMAQTLLEKGYRVVANSRNITKSNALTSTENLRFVDGDIADKAVAARAVDAAVQKFGHLDLLVNNAGIFVPKPFTDYTSDDFNRVLSTNLAGFFYVTQSAIAQMRTQKSGHVVNITTTLVDQPIAGVSAALTNLSKGGLQSVAKALAMEYVADGIRVNVIAPGVVNTPMHAPETHEFLKNLHPIHHLAEVSEIVDALLYLEAARLSPARSCMSMEVPMPANGENLVRALPNYNPRCTMKCETKLSARRAESGL